MSPELRKRMELVADAIDGLGSSSCWQKGAEWMHQEEVVPRDVKIAMVIKYCLPHVEMMWGATVISYLLLCDFRDSRRMAENYLKQFEKGGEGCS